mmetsp:Transcript_18015/g.30679  ORF Transcript_18015/g.30679 Transcript_18015/m.30679 type:complete len:189 (+) Transcript_18015:163-729(+)
MFKKISEAYAVLSNPNRRKRYDLYGETQEDEGMEDAFSGMDDLFSFFGKGGSGMFGGEEDDFEDFIKILEQDNVKQFKTMFRGLGKNYRMRGSARATRTRAAKGSKLKGGGKAEEQMMEDMMAMMMMGDLMSMGMEDDLDEMGGLGFGMKFPGGPKPKAKAAASKKKDKKPKAEEDDEWETDSGEEKP